MLSLYRLTRLISSIYWSQQIHPPPPTPLCGVHSGIVLAAAQGRGPHDDEIPPLHQGLSDKTWLSHLICGHKHYLYFICLSLLIETWLSMLKSFSSTVNLQRHWWAINYSWLFSDELHLSQGNMQIADDLLFLQGSYTVALKSHGKPAGNPQHSMIC